MDENEKIRFIFDLFNKNVQNISSVAISTEHGKYLFCLKVEAMSISVIIEDRFIKISTKKEIESFFKEHRIYQEIEGANLNIIPIGKDIVLWPNDEPCQKINRNLEI